MMVNDPSLIKIIDKFHVLGPATLKEPSLASSVLQKTGVMSQEVEDLKVLMV